MDLNKFEYILARENKQKLLKIIHESGYYWKIINSIMTSFNGK